MKHRNSSNNLDYDWFRNWLVDLGWHDPSESDVLIEIKLLVSRGKHDEAHITAGLWYQVDVEELGDAWMLSTMPGMKYDKQLSERRFNLRKNVMDELKAKLDGASYSRLCAAIHPKM